MDPSSIIAVLSPPDVTKYDDYSRYLHNFDLFLQFLDRHPNVVSAETQKPFKAPALKSFDKTLESVKAALGNVSKPALRSRLQGPVESSASDDDSVLVTPVTTVLPEVSSVLPTPQLVVSPPPTKVLAPVVPDVDGCTLLGKKKCVALLKEICSDKLAAHLVAYDKINRVPEEFQLQLDFLRRKSQKHGGVKLGLDLPKKDSFSTVSNGRTPYPDFKALWDSSASSS